MFLKLITLIYFTLKLAASHEHLDPRRTDYCLPKWTHRGDKGQYNWCCLITHMCCEGLQSPINIDTRNATRDYNCLNTEHLRCTPDQMAFINNGHNLELQAGFQLGGTPSMGDYEFDRVVFKFGHNSSQGSEHTLNNIRMPGEMQIVFKHKKYATIQEAKLHPHGVKMMSFFIAVGPYDNVGLMSVGDNQHKGYKHCFYGIDFGHFMPKRMSWFYEYEGSLTEPPCTHPVTWQIQHNPIWVSEKQLEILRGFKTNFKHDVCPKGDDCMMYNNFRRQQCRNKRPIKYYKDCGVHKYMRV